MLAYALLLAALAGFFAKMMFSPGAPAMRGLFPKPPGAMSLEFTRAYDAAYPTHAAGVHEACAKFGAAYDATFAYPATPLAALDRVRSLYSIREDALTACGEIKMRLSNDLAAERDFIRSYEDLDRRTNEYIEDAKARLGVFVHPGPMSSAFQAKRYRAANDVFS